MTPKLAELIAYCQASGIKGRYSCKPDGEIWRARITIGNEVRSGPAATRDEALERIAATVLQDLLDPQPVKGTQEWADWEARRRG